MTSKMTVNLSEVISPNFYEVHRHLQKLAYSAFWLTGGRSSTKSSFVALEIVLGMMRDRACGEITHAVCLRYVQGTIKDSIFGNIEWAIDKLNVSHLWRKNSSSYRWTYLPNSDNPQEIRFKGCDDPRKIKSIKFSKGYCKYMWTEETDEFQSAKDLQSIKLSLARRNDEEDTPFIEFRTWNPPELPNHWINIEFKKNRPSIFKHHSTYLDVPEKWLTKEFLEEATATKEFNENEYNHVFLGKVTGVAGLAYPMFDINKHTVELEQFTWYQNERINHIICGCDGGTVRDATTLIPMCVTSAGRIVTLPTFYYDPLAFNHTAIAPSVQIKLMERWLDYWTNRLIGMDCSNIVQIVVDSAAQDLVLEFNMSSKYKAIKVAKKDILIDMKRHQQVLTSPGYFTLINAGYIDPVNFKQMGDNDMYIEEIVMLVTDKKTGKPIDLDNHTIDGTNYGLYVATRI